MTERKRYPCKMCSVEVYSPRRICDQCAAQEKVYALAGMKMNPVGIMSKEIWIKKRMQELNEAINRYLYLNFPVPQEWSEELHGHMEELQRNEANTEVHIYEERNENK